MGYNTKHSINIKDISREKREKVSNKTVFEELISRNAFEHIFDKMSEFGEECHGYELENDLKKFSKEYPNKVFSIDGEGEESADVWKMIVINGEAITVRAELKFDNKKIKEFKNNFKS